MMIGRLIQLFGPKINRVFISYSSKDSARIVPLVEMMRVTGANVFRDTDNIRKGQKWRDVVETELKKATCLMLFWTENSAESSEVLKEFEYAFKRRIDIVPVFLEPIEVPEKIAEFQSIALFTETIESPSLPPGTRPVMTSSPTYVVHPLSDAESADLILQRLYDRNRYRSRISK
jgi:hypothetical protein